MCHHNELLLNPNYFVAKLDIHQQTGLPPGAGGGGNALPPPVLYIRRITFQLFALLVLLRATRLGSPRARLKCMQLDIGSVDARVRVSSSDFSLSLPKKGAMSA